jgi:hypothetical protein
MNSLIKLVSDPWFLVTVFVSVIGALVVLWGLKIGGDAEKLLPPTDFKEDIFGDIVKRYKAKMDFGHEIIMVGVAIEAICALAVCIISGLENADLKDKSTASNLEAKQAEIIAGQANERAAKIESNNLVLQANLLELEAKTKARRITLEQKEEFIKITKNYPKIPVKVCVGMADSETLVYADQIRDMLDAAGFGFTNKAEGIVRNDTVYETDKIKSSDFYTNYFNEIAHGVAEDPSQGPDNDVIIIGYSTNYSDGKDGFNKGVELPFDWNFRLSQLPYPQFITNNFGVNFIFTNTTISGLPLCFIMDFRAIQIKGYQANTKLFLNPGEWGVFVKQKIHR